VTIDEVIQLRSFNVSGKLMEVLQAAADEGYMLLEYILPLHKAADKFVGHRIFYVVSFNSTRIIGSVALRRSNNGFTSEVQESFRAWLRDLPSIDKRILEELENFTKSVHEINTTNGKELTDEDFTFVRDFMGGETV